MQSHDKTVIIGSKVQCQNCIFAHICKTAIIFGLLSRKKMCLKDIFYVIYITSLFDFMLKRFHKIFANFKCVNVFCKNTEYQTSHKTKVSIVLPICTFMFKSRFFFWTSQLTYTLQWLQKAYIWKAVMNQTLNESSGLYVTLWKCSLYVSMP